MAARGMSKITNRDTGDKRFIAANFHLIRECEMIVARLATCLCDAIHLASSNQTAAALCSREAGFGFSWIDADLRQGSPEQLPIRTTGLRGATPMQSAASSLLVQQRLHDHVSGLEPMRRQL